MLFKKDIQLLNRPVDLQRPQALGFSDRLLFFLMRRAGEHGKRLSDVVEPTWKQLKQAVHPPAYLMRLIERQLDFRRQTELRAYETAARQAQDAEATELDQILATAGTVYVDTGLTHRFAVVEDAQSLVAVRACKGIERTMPVSLNRDFVREIQQGRYVWRLPTSCGCLERREPVLRMRCRDLPSLPSYGAQWPLPVTVCASYRSLARRIV